MTNKELIEKLSQYPMNAEVVIPVPEDSTVWDKLKDIECVLYIEFRNHIGLIWKNRR